MSSGCYVNVTGQPVSKGQPLFEVYSPELVSAQREYAHCDAGHAGHEGCRRRGAGRHEATRGVEPGTPAQLGPRAGASGSAGEVRCKPQRTITFRSPVSGLVTEKKALQGMRFMPGEMLYQVTDLSSVWVIADVFEQDIGLVKTGAKAKVTINAYPNQVFEGRITYVYPTMKAETRTVAVRDRTGQPGPVAQARDVCAGRVAGGRQGAGADCAGLGRDRQRHAQDRAGAGPGRTLRAARGRAWRARRELTSRCVKGVREGEQVVVAANFLIDAESNLKAAVGGLGGHSRHGSAPTGTAPAGSTVAPSAPASIGHKAEGTVDGIDLKAGTVSLNHGPVATLKWPAMTMEFKAANAACSKA